MQTNLKQAVMRKKIQEIAPEVTVVFNTTKKAKKLLGTMFCADKIVKFYRPLFKYNLDSCLHCVYHELAHYYQWQISGYTQHDKQFEDIKDMLIADYGTKQIKAANKSKKSKRYSYYMLDNE